MSELQAEADFSDDVDDHRPIQRTSRCLLTVDSVLKPNQIGRTAAACCDTSWRGAMATGGRTVVAAMLYAQASTWIFTSRACNAQNVVTT